ncbi:hypothetical protein [Candidatus Leptofilum sp.]|uniref:hypothetical protein n=1 Tax=Candidatus Leptofilum sp. TaxID=3241576 RepID=UPI003B5BCA91
MMKRIGILLVTFVLATAVLSSIFWAKAALPLAETAVSQEDTHLYLPLVAKPSQPPQILSFTATVPIADPGDTITLSWKTSNATTVTLYHLFGGVLGTFWFVEPTGSMTYTISSGSRNSESFALYASSDDFPYMSASLTVPLTCPFAWFFTPAPDVCAQDAVLLSASAEQQFEHGVMIWVAEEDRIYVLFDDTMYTDGWNAYEDTWQDGDPIDDPFIVPPPGFYQPQRGFGLVWREQPQVRERLGWALAFEVGGDTAVQRTSYFKYNHIYLKALDNNIWHLFPERSDWEKLIPEAVE